MLKMDLSDQPQQYHEQHARLRHLNHIFIQAMHRHLQHVTSHGHYRDGAVALERNYQVFREVVADLSNRSTQSIEQKVHSLDSKPGHPISSDHIDPVIHADLDQLLSNIESNVHEAYQHLNQRAYAMAGYYLADAGALELIYDAVMRDDTEQAAQLIDHMETDTREKIPTTLYKYIMDSDS